jgi:hypothetical protein
LFLEKVKTVSFDRSSLKKTELALLLEMFGFLESLRFQGSGVSV